MLYSLPLMSRQKSWSVVHSQVFQHCLMHMGKVSVLACPLENIKLFRKTWQGQTLWFIFPVGSDEGTKF
jgi:hypothetical protein